MGNQKAVDYMPPEKKKKKRKKRQVVPTEEEPEAGADASGGAKGLWGARALRQNIPEAAGTGIHKDGRTLHYITPEGRSAWFCRYGWLVKDVVGTEPETMAANCRVRALAANALFSIHVLALAGLLAGWVGSGSSGSSTPQLGTALAIKAIWTQYVLAIRPYASGLALLVEVVPSCMELVVLVMGLLQASGAAMSTPPSTIIMVLVFAEVGFVSLVELVRALVVVHSMFNASSTRQKAVRTTKVSECVCVCVWWCVGGEIGEGTHGCGGHKSCCSFGTIDVG